MKTHPFLKAAALAALLAPLTADGNVLKSLRQALSWLQKTQADGTNVADIADIAKLTALLTQVVESLSAA
jgi:hypothetical protein